MIVKTPTAPPLPEELERLCTALGRRSRPGDNPDQTPRVRAPRRQDTRRLTSNAPTLEGSLTGRIEAVQKEVTSLQAARAALLADGGSHARRRTGRTGSAKAKPKRGRTSRSESGKSASTAGVANTAPTAPTPAAAPASSAPSAPPDVPSRKPRTRAKRQPAKRKQPVEVLVSGKLEEMLRDAPGGLNAVAIARAANARQVQVRELLRELERTGQVRRNGAGRGSRWRLITDEERIAERAAALAARSAPKP